MKNQKFSRILLGITCTSVMCALSVIFCRYLGYSPQNSAFRFEIGFLPIAVVAWMFGPIYSGLCYLLADIVGSLLNGYAPNPWISVCMLAFGVLLGIFFHRKEVTWRRTILAYLIINVLVDLVAKTPILIFMYGMPTGATYLMRAINAAITFPIRVVTTYFLCRSIKRPLRRFLRKTDRLFRGAPPTDR